MKNENNIESINSLIIKYPSNKFFTYGMISLYLFFLFPLMIFVTYGSYIDQEGFLTLFAVSVCTLAALYTPLESLYRIYKYDEVIVDNDFFIVKKKNKILSKIPIEDIEIKERRNMIDFYEINLWKGFYYKDELFFQFIKKEINEDERVKLKKLIGQE